MNEQVNRKWKTVLRPEAQVELRAIGRAAALRILGKLAELESDPMGFSTTALASRPERRRLRVGDYRVIYTLDAASFIVWVVRVAHRADVYRDQRF
jgi:mRNA interferase RelE/StbE